MPKKDKFVTLRSSWQLKRPIILSKITESLNSPKTGNKQGVISDQLIWGKFTIITLLRPIFIWITSHLVTDLFSWFSEESWVNRLEFFPWYYYPPYNFSIFFVFRQVCHLVGFNWSTKNIRPCSDSNPKTLSWESQRTQRAAKLFFSKVFRL